MSRAEATFALAHRAPVIDGVERLYRRRMAPRRRRPRLLGVAFSLLAKPVLALAVPAVLLSFMLTASPFALSAIEVSASGERVAAGWIEERLAPLTGGNVLRLSLEDVETRLAGHAWIEGVEITKRLPSGLRVRVLERRAAVLVRGANAQLWYSDAAGRLIDTAPSLAGSPDALGAADAAGELIVIEGARMSTEDGIVIAPEVPAALAVIAELGRAQRGWAEGLRRIRPLGDEDFELETEALPFPLRVQKGRIAGRAARLAELLGEIERRYERLAAVDLRFERRIVLQPWPPSGGFDRFLEGAPHGQAG